MSEHMLTSIQISHLLTHISSKGHLSNYYKMKVKGSQDPASQQIIDDYDDWYEEHNLQDMMQERMAQKENKKRSSDGALVRRSSTPGRKCIRFHVPLRNALTLPSCDGIRPRHAGSNERDSKTESPAY